MATEPTSGERQRGAFCYLRERARRAHLDGDGLQVNSLCAVTLSKIESLAKDGKLAATLTELAWCHIFPLYWFIDTYMMRAVERSLTAIHEVGKADPWLYDLARDYYFLVSQPLDNFSEQLSRIKAISFDGFKEGNQCEDLVLLTHIVELVWFRSTHNGEWDLLLGQWLAKCPAWCTKALGDLRVRLKLQTQLSSPSRRFPPLPVVVAETIPEEIPLGQLWIHLLHNDAQSLDRAIEGLNAIIEPDSHVARLLFDFHHANRFEGRFGEPQEVGLARRRLFTSSSPVLTFNELREAALSEGLGELLARKDPGGANQRFHVFQLAMLCEISALRLWDWPAWNEAVRAQSEAYLEASRWKETSPWMGLHGIRLAVQSGSYKSRIEETLTLNAISQLEFAPEGMLSELTESLTCVYSRQKSYAYAAFRDLSDLIPGKSWVSVAKWTVDYIDERRSGKHFGGPQTSLSLWGELLRLVDESSAIWALLLPEALNQARIPWAWRTEREFFRTWLEKAPLDLSRQVGLEMLAVEVIDADSRAALSRIALPAEQNRHELARMFTPKLATAATNPLERIVLLGPENEELKAAAKAQFKDQAHIMLNLAVPPSDAKAIQFGVLSNEAIDKLEWGLDDMPFLNEFVVAIENPGVLAYYLPSLLYCLQTLVLVGPREFAEIVFPRFRAWSSNPLVGRNPSKMSQGPFSTVLINVTFQSEIPGALGWLAFAMRQKLGTVVDAELANWLQRSVLNPEPSAVPIMVYAAFPAATTLSETARADLLATCQTLLLHLWGRHYAEKIPGDCLAQALSYIAALLRKEENSIIQWNTDGGRATLEILLSKFAPLIAEFGRSTHPDIRASVARLIHNLKRWKELPPQLEETFGLLAKDNRARVRFEVVSTAT